MNTRFLVVDDTKFMRVMLTDILVKLGYEVVGEADNGMKAIQLYRELQPDVVFMDISMPEMDGIEAMKQIKAIDPNATVIICSGASQQYLISDAMKAGATSYVLKPFKPTQIKELTMKYVVIAEESNRVLERKSVVSPYAELFAATLMAATAEVSSVNEVKEMDDRNENAGINEEITAQVELQVEDIAVEVELELEVVADEQQLNCNEQLDIEEQLVSQALTEVKEDFTMIMKDIITMHEQALNKTYGLEQSLEQPIEETMEQPMEQPVEQATELSIEEKENDIDQDKPAPSVLSAILPYKPKEETVMKEFTSSISCRWKENFGDQEVIYSAFCYEGESRVYIDFSNLGEEPGYFSFDGLRNLLNWIETKAVPLSNPVKEIASHS